MTCHIGGMITNVQIFGGHTPKIWEDKNVKTWHIFSQLTTLTANDLKTDQDIKNQKQN